MSNIFIDEPIYITIDELEASTSNTQVKDLDDEKQKLLITKSELIIDEIIGEYWEKQVSNQLRIFPTVDDNIPVGIKRATIRLCENLFIDWYLDGNSSNSTKQQAIKAEKYGDHAITYQDAEQVQNTRFKLYDEYIDDEIYMYLKPYLGGAESASNNNTWVIIG